MAVPSTCNQLTGPYILDNHQLQKGERDARNEPGKNGQFPDPK